jgi:hypothetical protein
LHLAAVAVKIMLAENSPQLFSASRQREKLWPAENIRPIKPKGLSNFKLTGSEPDLCSGSVNSDE